MKKRLLSMLLALSMLIGMVPTSVLAAGAPSVMVDGKAATVEERYDENEGMPYYVLTCPQGKDVSLTMEMGGIYMGEFAVEGEGELTINAEQLMQYSLPAEEFNECGFFHTVAEGNRGVELNVDDWANGVSHVLYIELTPADEPACDHSNAAAATDYKQVSGTEFHTVTVTCKCGEVQFGEVTTEPCVDADANGMCDLCKGTVAVYDKEINLKISDVVVPAGTTEIVVPLQVKYNIAKMSKNGSYWKFIVTYDESKLELTDESYVRPTAHTAFSLSDPGRNPVTAEKGTGCYMYQFGVSAKRNNAYKTDFIDFGNLTFKIKDPSAESVYTIGIQEGGLLLNRTDTAYVTGSPSNLAYKPGTITVAAAAACDHTETTTTYEQVEGKEEHTITVTCTCGEVTSTTAACEDTDGDLKCDVCEGTVACKHPADKQETVWAQVTEGEHISYTKCTLCGERTSQDSIGICADNDSDGKCDECGSGVYVETCGHARYSTKATRIEGENRHHVTKNCKECGAADETFEEYDEDCVDVKNNNDKNDQTPDGYCDRCKEPMITDSCQHTETTITKVQVEGTETHTITVKCANESCGEQIGDVTTEACVDADGNLQCDVCEGAVACKHPATTKNYVQVEGEEKHTVTEICVHPKCKKTLSEATEACVDADANGKCDLCGGTVAVSEVSVWDGTVPTSMTLETTTTADSKNAYVIRNAAEFAYWASKNHASGSKTDTWRTYTVLLETDIDLAGHKWSPPRAGKTGKNSIVFDGQGHTIKGLYINQSTKKTGLFGVVDGGIKNLTVIGEVTNTEDYTGGIVGQIGGFIENCAFYGTVNGGNYVGGIAGGADENASFTNCASIATVTSNGNGAGGIVGVVENTPAWNCYNAGDVSAEKYVGGIVGYAHDSDTGATIMNCYNVGGVTMTLYSETLGNNSDAGAIAGTGKHTVVDCYYLNVGVISGSQTNMAGTMKTEAELKSMVGALNTASDETYGKGAVWASDSYNLNNGYPIFTWQAPDVEELITLTAPAVTASTKNKTVTVTVPASEQDANAQIQYRMGTIVQVGEQEDYSWDNWQLDNKFYGLDAGTYVFQARYISSDIFAYVDSEPSDAVEAVVNEVDGVSPPAPVLTPEMVKTSTDGSTVTLDWSEYNGYWWPVEFGPEAVAAQFRIGIVNKDGSIIWNEWSNTVYQGGSEEMQYTFSGLTRNTQYAIQARFVGFEYAVDSPISAPLNLPASGMMKISFRLMGLTQPNTVGDVNTSALNRGGIDLKMQLEAARNGKVVDGYDGAVYRNLLQTAEYEVPAAINVSSFLGYPLAQNNLDFRLGVPTTTVIEVPELFWDDANDGHYINPNNWYYGTGTGWTAVVIRDGKVVSECKPYGATFVLQDGDSVVLCCVADTGYELKTNPTSPNFQSHAIATGLTDLIHKFLEFPDLSHEEYVPVLALEKQIEALKNNVDDKDIIAAEEAYAALSADQKTAVKHYEKLVAARETYDNQQLGDLNGDKIKDQKDVTLMIRFLAEMDMENEEGFTTKYADLNKDSKIDLLDLIILRRHLASGNGSWMDYQTLPYVPKK